MLAGGLRAGSITMALGTPGSGKTLLGLGLLAAGAESGEAGLYFGFSEGAIDLCQKAEGMGIPLQAHIKSGLVTIMTQSPLDALADALAERLLATVRARKVRRLFIDGLRGFEQSLVYPARSERFFTALCDELRALGVVTVISDETLGFGAIGTMELPRNGMTASLDNLIVLRHVELHARLHKLVSVVKMRGGAGDSAVREFSIDASGFAVTSDTDATADLLAEVIRESPAAGVPGRLRRESNKPKASKKSKKSLRARRR
jgi:circadian clock protein KaiC